MQTDRIQLIGILGPQTNDKQVFETYTSVNDNNLLETNTNTHDNLLIETNQSVEQKQNQTIGSDADQGNFKIKQMQLSEFYSELINDPIGVEDTD